MKYQDHKKRSAELLRMVIPKMSQHDAPFDPISYAVWYEYCAGHNKGLTDALDDLLNQHEVLTAEQIETLFRRHIYDCDIDAMRLLQERMRQVVRDVIGNTSQTTQHASGFSAVLKSHTSQLDAHISPEALKGIVNVVLDETQQMSMAIDNLQHRLHNNAQEIEQLRMELRKVREESMRDALTGLLNRGGFDKSLDEAMRDSDHHQTPLILALIDIDFFKKINDTHGHILGDRVIRHIAGIIRQQVRETDTAARYGGEEFALLLPHTPMPEAETLAQKIRSVVEHTRLKRLDNHADIGRITLSAGLALYQNGETARDLLQHADEALYQSKRTGRNKVTIYQP